MVDAAEEFDVAVRQPAGQVAGLVQPGPGIVAERIGDEALGGQLGPVQVAAGQAGAADVESRRRRRPAPAARCASRR